MTVQRAPDFLVAGRPGRAGAIQDTPAAGADRKNEIMNSMDKSPAESHTDNEHRLQRLLSEHDLLKKFIATHLFIHIKEEWKPETTLVDCVVKIGQMIVFQRYSIKAPLNKEAAQWTVQNNKLLPLSTIDFNRGADTAPSGPPTGAAAPVGAGRAADSKDAGDADTIIFEDAAAQLMKDKEPREDDTAQLSVEIEAPPAATSGKSGPGEVRPIPPTHPAKGVIPQHTQKKEPQAPAQQNRRFYGPENIPGEIAARKTAGYKVDNIFCVRCGMKNGIKADFCSRCGARLHTMMLQRMARMVIYVGTIVVLFLAAEVEIIVFLINP